MADFLYSDFNLAVEDENRDFTSQVKACIKLLDDGGRTRVRLSEGPDGEVETVISYFDKNGNRCGSMFVPGDPFGLGAPSDGSRAAAGITAFAYHHLGTPLVEASGLRPIAPADFLEMFTGTGSFFTIYDDIVALTDGGADWQGSKGNDSFDLGTGLNRVIGAAGDDRLYKTAAGAVTFDGEQGIDTLSFIGRGSSPFPAPLVRQMVVDLSTGTGWNPYGGRLTLTGIENVVGTGQADRTTGDARANIFGDGFLDGGADTIHARGGDDIVNAVDQDLIHANGGAGFDTFRFLGSIDLQDPEFASRVVNFEKFEIFNFFIGPPPSTMAGDGGANWFAADDGNDTLEGRGGDDTLDGGKAFNNDFSPGADVAVWSGNRGRYQITAEGGLLIVTDTRPGSPDGTDTVANIETLRFQDGDFSVAALFPDVGEAYFGTSGDNGFGVPFGATRNFSAFGYGGNDTFDGRDGDDRLFGGGGNDSLTGGLGDDLLEGGTGDDLYVIGFGRDEVIELADEGIDTIALESSSPVGSFSLVGYADIENLEARNFIPMTLTGNGLDNRITSDNGDDTLKGGAGDDTLTAKFGHDVLNGGKGDDVLDGGDGIGDRGEDVLFGGAGRDVFLFGAVADSTPLATDIVGDFDGDVIDLSAIDALAGGGDDAFQFIGSGPFTALGQVRVVQSGGTTLVEANVIGDLAADLRIQLTGLVTVGSGDLVL